MELEQANKDEVVPTKTNEDEVVNKDEVVPTKANEDEAVNKDELVPTKTNEDEVVNKDVVVPTKTIKDEVPTKPLTTNTPRSKKSDKKRPDASKDKTQTEEEKKPRPRPKYSDKSRKNRKNKSGQENKTEAVVQDTKVEESQGTEQPLDGDPTLTKQEGSTEITSEMQILALNSENEEDSWDTLFNDDGDCLEEGKGRKKKKNIQDAEFDYYNMDREADEDIEMTDDELSHIVEIYDFPQEFKTEDLLKLFESSQLKGLDIHWVDESHALALFSSAVAARDALRSKQPLLKVRPLSKSSAATKAKARSCSDYLLPAKERPPTSAMLARRMVMGALGVRSPQSKEDRDAEKKKIQEARDQKRMAAKQREDAWEGK